MRNLLVLFTYLLFYGYGARLPFVLTLGYIWTDFFQPQRIAYAYITELPVAMLMGGAAIGAHFLFDSKTKEGSWPATSTLLVMFAGWVTMTTLWAEVPEQAWAKWDWAIKNILFAAFLPLTLKRRIHIEAALAMMLVAASVHFLPFGIKTALTGGGYGLQLGIVGGNTGLAEGSTLAVFCASGLPCFLYFIQGESVLFGKARLPRAAAAALALAALLAVVGTQARAGLVSLAVVGGLYWLASRRKVVNSLIIAIFTSVAAWLAADGWEERMGTITDHTTDASAMGRVAAWRWTWEYVLAHPFGGGFEVYRINSYEIALGDTGQTLRVAAKAFHSIYFEVLGEQGFPGLALYLSIAGLVCVRLYAVARRSGVAPAEQSQRQLSQALLATIAGMLAGGAFIGIAFGPYLYYYFGLAMALTVQIARSRREFASKRAAPLPNPAKDECAATVGFGETPNSQPMPSSQSFPPR